jgi:hypothetical protein
MAMAGLALAWLVMLVILSRTQRAQQPKDSGVLPVYPEAYETDIKTVPDRDFSSANYLVPLDYPSLDVFTYYDDRMKEQGWSRQGGPNPTEWQVSRTEGRKHATLFAAWIGPNGLMRLDLQLTWDERKSARGESGAPPRMSVSASMSRNFLPFPWKAPEKKGEGEIPFDK